VRKNTWYFLIKRDNTYIKFGIATSWMKWPIQCYTLNRVGGKIHVVVKFDFINARCVVFGGMRNLFEGSMNVLG
jgi:hypothetical protein